MSTDNKTVVRGFYEGVFNTGDLARLDEIVAPEFVLHAAAPQAGAETGPAVLRTVVTRLRTAFPDVRFTVEDLFGEGDRVAVRWSMRGTRTGHLEGRPEPDGSVTTRRAISVFRLAEGRFAELWTEFAEPEVTPAAAA